MFVTNGGAGRRNANDTEPIVSKGMLRKTKMGTIHARSSPKLSQKTNTGTIQFTLYPKRLNLAKSVQSQLVSSQMGAQRKHQAS